MGACSPTVIELFLVERVSFQQSDKGGIGCRVVFGSAQENLRNLEPRQAGWTHITREQVSGQGYSPRAKPGFPTRTLLQAENAELETML